jgi:hypothetical protein
VYVNEGIQIAQGRSLVSTDRLAASCAGARHAIFFFQVRRSELLQRPLHGIPSARSRSGHGDRPVPAGISIWIAIAYGLDGVTGTRRVIAWWAILGVLTCISQAAPDRSASRRRGCRSPFRARHPDVVRALPEFRNRHAGVVFAALLAHAYAHEDDDRFFGPVAASLLGLALFTRLPVVVGRRRCVAASLSPQSAAIRPAPDSSSR